MSQPLLQVAMRRHMVSIGISPPMRMWGQDTALGDCRYLLSMHTQRVLYWRAWTLIIGPLFLQFSWRMRRWA